MNLHKTDFNNSWISIGFAYEYIDVYKKLYTIIRLFSLN